MWDRCLSKRYGVYSKLRFWLIARWWWRGEFRATVYLWFRWWRMEFESSSAGLSQHLQPGRAAKIPHTTFLREGCSLLVIRNARHCPVLELQQRKTPQLWFWLPHGHQIVPKPEMDHVQEIFGEEARHFGPFFSNAHHNYFSAWRYVSKCDERVLESDGHPDLRQWEWVCSQLPRGTARWYEQPAETR